MEILQNFYQNFHKTKVKFIEHRMNYHQFCHFKLCNSLEFGVSQNCATSSPEYFITLERNPMSTKQSLPLKLLMVNEILALRICQLWAFHMIRKINA